MWIPFGFGALGLLIGSLVALTAESVVSSTLSLLFTFVGGSIIVVLHKLGPDDRKLAGASIFAMSACCLIALYLGIFTTQYRLLSPRVSLARSGTKEVDFHYLRSAKQERANQIDTMRQQKQITPDDAYEQMYRLALETADASRDR